ncbi:MAG: nitroreductase family protein [Promethearchaeota archaeon]
MPIIGIDYDKCINCNECMMECPNYLYEQDSSNEIKFNDPKNSCIKCGHCISVCPVDAILYENMGETIIFNGIEKPEKIIPFDQLYKILQSIRSVRRYKNKKVPEDLIKKITDAMQFAPTGANIQSEKITVISDPVRIKQFSDAIIEAMNNDARYSPLFSETYKKNEKRYNNAIALFDAPHVIVVHTKMPLKINYFNMANMITNGRLAAQSLGLGTCYIGQAQMASEIVSSIKKIAGASSKHLCAFTLGYPDVKYVKIPPRVLNRSKVI